MSEWTLEFCKLFWTVEWIPSPSSHFAKFLGLLMFMISFQDVVYNNPLKDIPQARCSDLCGRQQSFSKQLYLSHKDNWLCSSEITTQASSEKIKKPNLFLYFKWISPKMEQFLPWPVPPTGSMKVCPFNFCVILQTDGKKHLWQKHKLLGAGEDCLQLVLLIYSTLCIHLFSLHVHSLYNYCIKHEISSNLFSE